MNNAEFRKARQSDPRKGTPRDHDAVGDPSELVISGFEDGTRDERWQFNYALANSAQAWAGGADEGGAEPAADELFADDEGAGGVQGLFRRAGTDCESGKEMKKNLAMNFVTQSSL
jgi:hypothetical protein